MDLGLSKRGEYVVRSAIALARAYPSDQPLKLRQVSEETGVPRTFVSQILGDLVHAGLAVSALGVRGGYRLSRSPEEVNLLDVVEAGEGPLATADCGLEDSCPWRADCPLLDTFSAATVRVRAVLTGATLADLVGGDWSETAVLPCPARGAEEGGEAAVSSGRVGPGLPAAPGGQPAVPGGDRRGAPEDVVQHAVQLVAEDVSTADGRRPERDDREDDGVDDDGDQRGRHRDTHSDPELTAHGPSLRSPSGSAEPRDPGTASPRYLGAGSGNPPTLRDSTVPYGPAASEPVAPDRGPGDGPRPRPRGARGPRDRRTPITVVIVDDHALVREGSVQLLEAEPDIEVVGVAGSGEDGLGVIERLRPGVALVDVNLPGMSGLELARRARERQLDTRVLIVSAYDDYGYITEALGVGVGGYLLKTASAQELVDSIRLVVDGVMVLDRAVSSRLRRRMRSGPAEPAGGGLLTPREVDVLQLLVDGRPNKEIAAALHLGLRTVESHVSNVLCKLGATSRTQAVALALRQQVVSPSDRYSSNGHGGAVEHG